jgi:hypothetical protein
MEVKCIKSWAKNKYDSKRERPTSNYHYNFQYRIVQKTYKDINVTKVVKDTAHQAELCSCSTNVLRTI